MNDPVLIATSGTSGEKKWVVLSLRALEASAESVNKFLNASSSDVFFQALPEIHVGGLGLRIRAELLGARYYNWRQSHSKWDAESFLQTLTESRATITSLVPTQVYDLVKYGFVSPPSLRVAVVGGAALSHPLYFEGRKLGWPLLPSFGMTETASQIATASLSSLTNSSTTSFPNLEILSHAEVKTDAHGKLFVKGPSLFSGYQATNSPQVIDPKIDGWFETSDFAQISGKYIVPLGRSSDFAKIGGELVSSILLEEKLSRAVMESSLDWMSIALAFVPDERLGQSVHLFVGKKQKDFQLIQQVVDQFNQTVRPFEKIRTVKIVDEIPRTELGKINKAVLLQLA